jgi:hypothetical protein
VEWWPGKSVRKVRLGKMQAASTQAGNEERVATLKDMLAGQHPAMNAACDRSVKLLIRVTASN